MVFRNETSNREGKTSSGGDIFYDVYEAGGLNARFVKPGPVNLLEPGDSLEILYASSLAADLSLFVNGNLMSQASGARTKLYID